MRRPQTWAGRLILLAFYAVLVVLSVALLVGRDEPHLALPGLLLAFSALWGELRVTRWAREGKRLAYQLLGVAGGVTIIAACMRASLGGWLLGAATVALYAAGHVWWDRTGRAFFESGRGF
jgi:hypothetical protein